MSHHGANLSRRLPASAQIGGVDDGDRRGARHAGPGDGFCRRSEPGSDGGGRGADNARRQRAILDTLRALGLAGDRVSTMNYNVSPEMQYSPNGQTPPKVTGYTVTNTVRAEVRRLDDVGRVIDAALAKGANEISSLQFFSSKADSARRAALAAAVADARADAEALARGRWRYARASCSSSRPRVSGSARCRRWRWGGWQWPQAKTPIEPGQQTVVGDRVRRDGRSFRAR